MLHAPSQGADRLTNLNLYLTSMEPILECDASLIWMGDFNFPDIEWCVNELVPTLCASAASSVFIDFVSRHALLQFVKCPTRGENIPDLVLCNDAFAVSELRVEAPFSSSDHNSVVFKFFLCNYKSFRFVRTEAQF